MQFGLKAARFILALNGHVSILNIHVRCRLKTTGHLSLSMSQWGSEESHVAGFIIFMCYTVNAFVRRKCHFGSASYGS